MREPDKFIAYADSDVRIRCHIVDNAGADITQAALDTIAYKTSSYGSEDDAQEQTDATAVTTNGSLTISSVVFDTLQTPDTWTADSDGYNFLHTLPASERTSGHKWHRVDYLFTDTSGGKFRHAVIIETLPVQ